MEAADIEATSGWLPYTKGDGKHVQLDFYNAPGQGRFIHLVADATEINARFWFSCADMHQNSIQHRTKSDHYLAMMGRIVLN